MSAGFVERIFLAPQPGGELVEAPRVRVVANGGIEGDRYFGAKDEPGQNITLVEAEIIDAFNANFGTRHALSCTRRNLVTRGVRLAPLVGSEFVVGDVRLRGVELCEPCMGLGEGMAAEGVTPAAAVRFMAHRAGIRADVLSSGAIDLGATVSGGSPPMEIRVDDLASPEVIGLLREHLHSMTPHSPLESIHALDLDGLRRPEVTFWSVWQNDDLMGCGAIKELDPLHGEIKSMRTASSHLRKGVAAALIRHILDEARRRCYRRLSLETGSMDAFAPARSLYAKFGFTVCPPFGDYVLDPYSVFMTREV